MKKFIAVGITALGGFGLLGMGATAASATPGATGSVQAAVCASLTQSVNNNLTPLANAGAAKGTADTALTAATTAYGTALTGYETTVLVYVQAVDAKTAGPLAVATTNYVSAVNTLVTSITTMTAAQAADSSAVSAFNTINDQNNVLIALKAEFC